MCSLRSFSGMMFMVVASAATLFARPAPAVTLSASGMTSGANPVPIAASAEFALSGTTLSVVLSNVSPNSSTSADQMLSSFYFDIVRDGSRPTLTYESASGFVWKLKSNAADEPFNYAPPAVAGGTGTSTLATGTVAHVPSDLKAVKDNDRTWQFRGMNEAAAPFLGFGIGTVGNGGFGGGGGNGFTESIVGPPGPNFIAFSIYKNGDIQPVGTPVRNQFLVHNSATFTFSSAALADYSAADIAPRAVFGFGTGPDTVLVVPEPAGLALLAVAGMLGGLAWLKRSRRRHQAECDHHHPSSPLPSAPTLAVEHGCTPRESHDAQAPRPAGRPSLEGWRRHAIGRSRGTPIVVEVNQTWGVGGRGPADAVISRP